MGTMAAALWDVLAKAANLAQMSGLHAVMLVAVGATLLRIPQSNRECAELESCARRLSALLQWPTTSSGAGLLCPDTMALIGVNKALGDAAGLVDSYKKSAMWCRLRRGRSMSRQLRDMQDVVNSYYCVVLYINAHLLILQATTRNAAILPEFHRPYPPTANSHKRCTGVFLDEPYQASADLAKSGRFAPCATSMATVLKLSMPTVALLDGR